MTKIAGSDPDPLVRGMDPRIRIHTKMSWIRNAAFNKHVLLTCYRQEFKNAYLFTFLIFIGYNILGQKH